MQQTTHATICKAGSVLLLAISIPWVVYGQMGMGGGGMGGMGGGLGGMESPREKWLEELAKNPISWERPEGDVPFWLKNGKVACDSTNFVRDQLNKVEEVDLVRLPVSAFFRRLKEILGIQFDLDTRAFTEQNLSADESISFQGIGPIRDLLRRALEPLNLTYIVHENSVEITTISSASQRPVIRYYDLGYVQSDSKNLVSIIATIEQAVEPDSWRNSGGNGSIMPIGQLLVVSATEKAHLGIEKLLYRLSPLSKSEPRIETDKPLDDTDSANFKRASGNSSPERAELDPFEHSNAVRIYEGSGQRRSGNTMLGGDGASTLKMSTVLPEEKAMIVGTVTFRGKPIVANLVFHFEGGAVVKDISYSLDGQYQLALPKGYYTITLEGKGVPAKYKTVEDSPLKYKVESGRNLFDITLDDSPTVSPPTKR